MKDEESRKATTPLFFSSAASVSKASGSATGPFCRKNGHKFWILSAILLLAFWSMLTGSINLEWSSILLSPISDQFDFARTDDLDILEVEEREKVVKRMWNVYVHSGTGRLPRFWQDAFEAAYEFLVSDTPTIRNEAVSEIAKMSLYSLNADPVPAQTSSLAKNRKVMKQEKQVV